MNICTCVRMVCTIINGTVTHKFSLFLAKCSLISTFKTVNVRTILLQDWACAQWKCCNAYVCQCQWHYGHSIMLTVSESSVLTNDC